MKSIKLLHCADIHFDMPFTSLGNDGRKAGIRRAELRQCFQRIISLAKEERVDLLLICGDLFEQQYVHGSTISFICDEFEKIRDIAIAMIPGNHDPFHPGSYYKCHKWPDNVHILPEEGSFFAEKEKGLYVFHSTVEKNQLNTSDINICMAHGTLDMNIGKNTFNPISSTRLEGLGADYIALGHFHNRIGNAGKKGTVFNPGSPEPLGFDEEGIHGVFIAEICKSECATELKADFVPTCKRSFINITANADGAGNTERLLDIAREAIQKSGSVDDLYNVTFKGTVAKGFAIDKNITETLLADKAFLIKIKDETLPGYDLESIRKEPGIRGLFVEKMLERINKAVTSGDEEEISIAWKALYYGMEAIGQGEICI